MGGITGIGPDNRVVYDQSGSVSKVPNLQLNTNDTMMQSAMQSASVYESMGQNYATQAASLKASSVDQMAQAMATEGFGTNKAVRFNEHASSEVREAYNRIEQEASELSRNHGQSINK